MFFWTRPGFDYGYGVGFRDKNSSNLDNGILKVGENFETCEQRNVIGLIAIRVDDLLISWSEMRIEYTTQGMKAKSEVDSYGENE